MVGEGRGHTPRAFVAAIVQEGAIVKLPFNVPFAEASDYFGNKLPLTADEVAAIGDWSKALGFTVATVTKANVLQGILDAAQSAIDDGLTFADFSDSLRDIMDVQGWTGLTPWHAETVFRTNTQSSYGRGRWNQQYAQRGDFPFLQYITGSRPRLTHAALNGTVFAISDPRARTYYPPWAPNCNCAMESLTTEEAQGVGIEPVNVLDDGGGDPSGFVSPAKSDTYDPDLSALDPALRAKVEQMLARFNQSSIED